MKVAKCKQAEPGKIGTHAFLKKKKQLTFA